MEPEYGQIWVKKNDPEFKILITGTQDFIWYMTVRDYECANNLISQEDDRYFSKMSKRILEKYFIYFEAQIKKRSFWKTKANNRTVVILELIDNGINRVTVYYDLSKENVRTFLHYFTPCTKEEIITFTAANMVEKLLEQYEEKSRMDRVIQD